MNKLKYLKMATVALISGHCNNVYSAPTQSIKALNVVADNFAGQEVPWQQPHNSKHIC